MIGHLVGAAEADLGWKRPREKVDRRTWAALIGLSVLLTRKTAEDMPRYHGENIPTPKEAAGGIIAGMFLNVNETAIIRGYSNGRA